MNPEELLAQRDFVRRLACNLIRDENSAEDISQQACLLAMTRPPRRAGSKRGWLGKVVKGLTVDFFRREERRSRRERSVARPEGVPSSEEIAKREEIRRKVVEAVDSLEEPYGSAVILRYYEDLSVAEIALRLDVSTEAVKKRIQRGLGKLRARLDAEFHGDREAWSLALAPIAGVKLAPASAAAVSAAAVSSASTAVPAVITGAITMSAKLKTGILAAVLLGSAAVLFCLLKEDAGESSRGSGGQYEGAAGTGGAAENSGDKELSASRDDEKERTRDRTRVEPTVEEFLITGTVLSREDDSPVPGAAVVLTKLPHQESLQPFQVSTDDEGFFSATCFLDLESDVSAFHLHFTCEGYRDLKTVFPLLDSKKTLNCGNFYLDVNHQFNIRILDEKNKPVSGARLRIFEGSANSIFLDKFSDTQGSVSFTASEIFLGKGGRQWFGLNVRAPGFSDFVYSSYQGGPSTKTRLFPDEIVLPQHSIWVGRVVDAETGRGISGATVCYESMLMRQIDFIPESRTTSDPLGHFQLPIIVFEDQFWTDNRSFHTTAWAECYRSFSSLTLEDPYPGIIELRKDPGWITCVAVVDDSSEILANTRIEFISEDRTTDENGCFRISGRHARRFMATIPDRKLLFYGKLDIEGQQSGFVVVPFKPTPQLELRSLVVDELGCPVVEANCRLVSQISDDVKTGNDRSTDVNGMAVHELCWVDCPKKTYMEITHPEFCRLVSEPFMLGGDECIEHAGRDRPMKFVLRRGIVFRNIRVLDPNGERIPYVQVTAEFCTRDGENIRLYDSADRRGLCTMTFPPFDQGKIYVDERPDIATELDYNRIMKGEWINLVVHDEMNPGTILEGIVVDERGMPINDVRVRPAVAEGEWHWIDAMNTGEDGKFKFPVLGDRLYVMSFHKGMDRGVMYTTQEETGLKAGDYFTVTMPKRLGVEVRIRSSLGWEEVRELKKKGFKAWLEREDGSAVDAGEEIDSWISIIFLDIPNGKLRAVVRDCEGELHRSGFFLVKEGRCEEVPVIDMKE